MRPHVLDQQLRRNMSARITAFRRHVFGHMRVGKKGWLRTSEIAASFPGGWERGGDDADLEVARAGNWDVRPGPRCHLCPDVAHVHAPERCLARQHLAHSYSHRIHVRSQRHRLPPEHAQGWEFRVEDSETLALILRKVGGKGLGFGPPESKAARPRCQSGLWLVDLWRQMCLGFGA